MRRLAAAFGAGLLFAIGLGLSGMTDANKIIGFLNLAGPWDPSLGFVMVGAIGVHFALYKVILRRPSPLLAATFQIPTRRDIDARLVIGAGVFGAGWGLGGFCPGPGVVSLFELGSTAVVFLLSMLGGMVVFKLANQPRHSVRRLQPTTS
jgi:uncharacterized protein